MGFADRLRGMFRSGGKTRDDAVRQSMMFAGRARLITHLMDEWGEDEASEFAFSTRPPGFDPLLVFEFAPWRDRTWWTYSTAGLSICPAMDSHPPTELVAYTESQGQGLVDLLHQLAFKQDVSRFYRPGDIVTFDSDPPDLGIPLGRHVGLLPAPEREAVTDFPNVDVRKADLRYLLARPGEDATRVQFLRVVALVDGDRARWNGTVPPADARAWKLY